MKSCAMSSADVTVIVPTCDRSDCLRRALQSVADQDDRSSIAEVVVIENSTHLESQNVCQEFHGLPIHWQCNSPPLPMSTWAQRVFTAPSHDTEFIAFLCDDDWWCPGHLRAARRALQRAANSAASWSRVIEHNEQNCNGFIRGHTLWLVADYAMGASEVPVSLTQMTVANLLTTAVHISGFVGRQSALRRILPKLCNGNPFDIDRHLAVLMATEGTTIFLPGPTVGVAQHPQQESRTLGRTAEAQAWWRRTTREIIGIANEQGFDLANELGAVASRNPEGFAALLRSAYFDGLSDLATMIHLPSHVTAANRRLRVRKCLNTLLTPALLRRLGLRAWVEPAPIMP